MSLRTSNLKFIDPLNESNSKIRYGLTDSEISHETLKWMLELSKRYGARVMDFVKSTGIPITTHIK